MKFFPSWPVVAALIVWLIPNIAASQPIRWSELSEHLWLADEQKWKAEGREITFTALKFHLGFYRLSLVDVSEFMRKNTKALADVNSPHQFSGTLIDAGIRNIFRSAWKNDLEAVFPAGWSTTLRRPEQAGLLTINGRRIVNFDVQHPALSAVLCLESPAYDSSTYKYQIPAIYELSNQEEKQRASTCKNSVQIGPRILDNPTADGRGKGISRSEVNIKPQQRLIFALDEPQRSFSPNTSRLNARNGYIIYVSKPAHLWDIQTMLLTQEFYGGTSKPYRAVNLSGGGPSGLAIKNPTPQAGGVYDREPMIRGNPSGIVGSVMLLNRVQ